MGNNYLRQAAQARERFLTYDQVALIGKLGLSFDETYLYPVMLGSVYRIHRTTGSIQRQTPAGWVEADYQQTMTLLDLVCDSAPERFPTHRWKAMGDFGRLFHQSLLEEARDPWAEKFQSCPEAFRRACQTLGGREFPQGDVAYVFPLFDGLSLVLQLWLGDEEFPPSLRLLWDENAPMYLKYETMYFAKEMLLEALAQAMPRL